MFYFYRIHVFLHMFPQHLIVSEGPWFHVLTKTNRVFSPQLCKCLIGWNSTNQSNKTKRHAHAGWLEQLAEQQELTSKQLISKVLYTMYFFHIFAETYRVSGTLNRTNVGHFVKGTLLDIFACCTGGSSAAPWCPNCGRESYP